MKPEEKARAYDEAINKAKSLYKATEPMSGCNVILKTIFPELKEFEDERIRKELLEHCKSQAEPYIQTGNKCPQIQSWIAWLEKQGQVKESTSSQHEIETCKENNNSLTCEDEKVRKALISVLTSDFEKDTTIYGITVEEIIAWLEKQAEQKPNPYNGISFEYNGHIWGMCARDNGVDISCDKHLIKHLEKQGDKDKLIKELGNYKVKHTQ